MRSPTVYMSVDGHCFIISEIRDFRGDFEQNHKTNFLKIYILCNRLKIKSYKP